MESTYTSIVGLGLASVALVVLTPVISLGMWKFYQLLGKYHPTPADLEEYLENNPDEPEELYKTEGWFTKFGLTFAINLLTVMIALMLVIVYGILILDLELTPSAVFVSGIVIVAVNTSLRLAELMSIPWIEQTGTEAELLSFGHNFYTSLWVLTAIGGTVTVLSNVGSAELSPGPGWTLWNTAFWVVVLIVFVTALTLALEYVLSEHVDIDEDSLDLEYDRQKLEAKLEEHGIELA